MIRIYGNNSVIKQSIFPAGETYINVHPDVVNSSAPAELDFYYEGDQSFIQLLMVVNALRVAHTKRQLSLNCFYFPGARQDRVCLDGDAFSLRVYANLINSCNFEKVKIFDPHSDVCPAVVWGSEVVSNLSFVKYIVSSQFDSKNCIFVSPDAGANKKVQKLSQTLKIPFIRADKIRDLESGKIVETKVYTDGINLKDKNIIIIDDILSGGRTFIELAQALKKIEPSSKVSLIVSHNDGIADPNKLQESGIKEIYTTNSTGPKTNIPSFEVRNFI